MLLFAGRIALVTLAVVIVEMTTTVSGATAQTSTRIAASETDSVPIEVSSLPMVRNASLLTAAAKTADLGADAALSWLSRRITERPTWKGRLARLAKLYAVDAPFASLAHVLNHEYGHASALSEHGQSFAIRITKLPWPVPLTYGETIGGVAPLLLRYSGGGPEASQLMAASVLESTSQRGSASYFDALLYAYAKLDVSAYVLTDMSRERLQSSAKFFATELGDPRLYALTLASSQPGSVRSFAQVQEAGHSMRRGAWLNLIDYALVTQLASLGREYVFEGRRMLRHRPLRVGQIEFMPRVSYNLGALGPEYSVSSWVASPSVQGMVNYRWGDTVTGSRAAGVGLYVAQWRNPRLPTVRIDAWSQPRSGFGGRLEVGGQYPMPCFGRRCHLMVAAGAKSSGYLIGLPERSVIYGSVGLVAPLVASASRTSRQLP